MRKGQQKCFSTSKFDRFLLGREAKLLARQAQLFNLIPLFFFALLFFFFFYTTLFPTAAAAHPTLLCLSFELSLSVRGAAPTHPPPVLPRSTPPPSNMTTFSPYTDNPSLEPNVVFPRPEMQALSAVICALS